MDTECRGVKLNEGKTEKLARLNLQGPLTVMSETELIHWMRCAGVRTAATALPPLSELLDKFGEQRASMTHMFQVGCPAMLVLESRP